MHGREMYAAYDAKNYAKVFEVGRPAVKADPENFLALSLMVEAGYDSAVAGKTGFVAEAADDARIGDQTAGSRKAFKSRAV